MDPHASPVILMLAAGEGRRFGGAKQLADLAGQPMVRHVARTLLQTHVPVVAVTGSYAENVESALTHLPLSVVRCETWQMGMGESLAAGTREVVRMFPDASALMVCLADQPLLSAAWLCHLLDRHAHRPDHIFATRHDGITGPPVLFPRDCLAALSALSGPHGARALLKREASRVQWLDAPDFFDVDTQEDLQRIRALLSSRPLER